MAVILHVGAHKTGTSLIQKYFRDRPIHPADPRVAAVPRSDTNHLIGWGQHVLERPELLRDRIDAEVQTGPADVLISHENTIGAPFDAQHPGLYPHAAEIGAALARLCDGLDGRLVLYVRPLADFVESYYLQTIQQGAWHSFDEWFATVEAPALSWVQLVAGLQDAFGAQRVVVGDFTEISGGQDEFLRRFIVRTGMPVPSEVRYRPVRNASISARGLVIARQINRHLTSTQERKAARKFLQDNFSNRAGDRATPMPDDVRDALERQDAAEYAELSKRSLDQLGAEPPSGDAGRGALRRSTDRLKSLAARR